MTRSPDYKPSPVSDWLDGLENRCVVCGGPQLGVHYHEIDDDDDDDYEDGLSDIEADAMTLASAGWGTDEDYGYYGSEEY